MASKHEHKTALFEDGTHAVLRFDPADPLHMEVIAIFYEAAHAQDYVRRHTPAEELHEEKRRAAKPAAKGAPKRRLAAKPAQALKTASKPLPAATRMVASEAKSKRAARPSSKPAPAAKAKEAVAGMTERQAAVL